MQQVAGPAPNLRLARYYVRSLKDVAEKHVLRLEPAIKRSTCRKCDMPLVPGITSRVRTRAERERHTVVTCLHCGEVKRYLSRAAHALRIDAVAE